MNHIRIQGQIAQIKGDKRAILFPGIRFKRCVFLNKKKITEKKTINDFDTYSTRYLKQINLTVAKKLSGSVIRKLLLAKKKQRENEIL